MPSPIARAASHRFAMPAAPFQATTSDGVELMGTRLGEAEPALVVCHGFSGWHRKPRPARFAEALSRWFTVYGFDFRGHGLSGGHTTFGALEIHDVAAVMALARDEGHAPVGTLGGSMGGVSVIRHAALLGGTDAVVAISTPARWDGHASPAVRRLAVMAGTRRGRRLGRALGVRIPEAIERQESPEDVVGKIAPTPLLIVHGRDDHFFDEEEAWRLYRRAGRPAALWMASRFGHGEDGFSDELAEKTARWLYGAWGLPWPG